jgi:4-oxalocrotonate tautomerase
MPLVRIDLSKNASKERIRAVSDAVYGAVVEIANVPLHDKFQIITRHADDEISIPRKGISALSTAAILSSSRLRGSAEEQSM